MGMHNLALILLNTTSRHADALKLFEEALVLREAKLGPDHPDTLLTLLVLGLAQIELKNYTAAETRLLDFQARVERNSKNLPPDFQAYAIPHLIRLYDAWGKQDQAAEWRKRQEVQRQAEKK
jgi:hypothetical protein